MTPVVGWEGGKADVEVLEVRDGEEGLTTDAVNDKLLQA